MTLFGTGVPDSVADQRPVTMSRATVTGAAAPATVTASPDELSVNEPLLEKTRVGS